MKILPPKHIILLILAGTIAIELLTIAMRFGLQLQATRDTASTVGVLTGGIRIHHGYIGVLLFLSALSLRRTHRPLAQRILIIGASLVLSDLIHHFVVLWLLVGNPEFHLIYPGR